MKAAGHAFLALWILPFSFVLFMTSSVPKSDRTLNDATIQAQTQAGSGSSSESSKTKLDTTHWKTLTNKYGWRIKYPADWYATANSDEVTARTSAMVELGGPKGCPDATHQRCAFIQIFAAPGQDASVSNQSPEEYLGFGQNHSGHPLSEQVFKLDGLPAAESTGFVDEQGATREIAVKHEGQMLIITYIENTNIIVDQDKEVPVKSPADWKYKEVFDKMLDTMSFYEVPKSVFSVH